MKNLKPRLMIFIESPVVMYSVFIVFIPSSMIKADGNFIEFFNRSIAGTLGVLTLLIQALPVVMGMLNKQPNRKGLT